MEKKPLAAVGNVVHIYDFRVKPGTGDEFARVWDLGDKSGENPMHLSSAQVKDGVLCRDMDDADHFYLLGEWKNKEAHYEIWKPIFGSGTLPKRFSLVEGAEFIPTYTKVVA